jgi:DNA repair ATPase RecN
VTNALSALQITNFQSLPKAEIDFPERGVVAIVGPSSLGKSAVIRALRLLVRNGSAPGLVRKGAATLGVTATFTDGQTITVHKGAKVSEFVVNGEKYAKTGVSAPEQVENFWKIPQPDGRELCFSGQHETPFLLAEPASAVAKVLGDLTNAALLMAAVQKANRLRQEALADERARAREAVEAQGELAAYHDLPARGSALDALEIALGAATRAQESYAVLHRLLDSGDKLVQFCEQAEATLQKTSDHSTYLDTAERLAAHIVAAERAMADVRKHATALKTAEARLQIFDEKIQTLITESGKCPLCGSETA